MILLEGKGSRKIAGLRRKVLRTNEVRKKGVAVGGQIVQQPAKTNEMVEAGSVAPGRLLLAQRTEPAEEMGIAAQPREAVKLRESGAEMGEEATRGTPIMAHRTGPQSEGERLDVRFEDLLEAVSGLIHERCEESSPFRFWIARAYSRQTSCGASWM